MGVNEITIADFKSWFSRDFIYVSVPPSSEDVTDFDLQKAFDEAEINFNEGLFEDQKPLKICFLYLAAHYLVNDRQTAVDGLNSTGYYAVASKSVGKVSESYNIPDAVNSDPILAPFTTTRYGQKYLSMIRPLLTGVVTVYQGATTPN